MEMKLSPETPLPFSLKDMTTIFYHAVVNSVSEPFHIIDRAHDAGISDPTSKNNGGYGSRRCRRIIPSRFNGIRMPEKCIG